MFWGDTSNKQRIRALEAEVTSLKEHLSEVKNNEKYLIELCNKKHEMIRDLREMLLEAKEPSVNVEVPPAKSAFVLGQNLAKALWGKRS